MKLKNKFMEGKDKSKEPPMPDSFLEYNMQLEESQANLVHPSLNSSLFYRFEQESLFKEPSTGIRSSQALIKSKAELNEKKKLFAHGPNPEIKEESEEDVGRLSPAPSFHIK